MAPKKEPLHREQVAPVPRSQAQDERERNAPQPKVAGWTSEGSFEAVDSNKATKADPTAGKPKGDHDGKKTLVEAGTTTAGDGSADGGLNADEGHEPKSKSKL
ncbi:hypothetical protein OIV83_003154 [Microbotryomycetes sp. JL201]|nr:hypothetical protein OIV83_003154 [Microbotryomycetes sp. JL201]